MSRTPRLLTLLTVGALAAGSGCSGLQQVEHGLASFGSCAALDDHLTEVVLDQLVQSRYGRYGWGRGGLWGEEDDFAADSDGGSSAPSDYTETNVQEAGVDEADFVKTNGTHIFAVQRGRLQVVRSWPVEDSEMIASVPVDGEPLAMFLHEDQVVVFSYQYTRREWNEETGEYEVVDDTEFPFRNGYGTRITRIDVSNPSAPRVIDHADVDGWFSDGRMIDGQVYLILNSWSQLPQDAWDLVWDEELALPEVDWEASDEEWDAAAALATEILRPHVTAVMENYGPEDLLPRMQTAGGPVELLHQCTDMYRPESTSELSTLSVVHLDLTEGSLEIGGPGLLASGWTLYASQDNLYVAQSSRWWWGWSGDMTTAIHKFSLGTSGVRGLAPRRTPGEPVYTATGAVEGWLLDQFAMSEWDGHLRVASTGFDWWSEAVGDAEGGSMVTVLEQAGGALEEVGQVRNIAPGERIMASRMMGDKGYLVTFRQTDPLFTIDLADHSAPEVMGELEIPGFSGYLHPLGDDHLLAVGRDGDEEGRVWGVNISIFDVSDFTDPTLAHRHSLSMGDSAWGWSEALWDHHAFTYHRDVLSIPHYVYDYDETTGEYDYFSGLVSMQIDPEDGIREVGRVDHRDLVGRSECLYGEWACGDGGSWYARVRRSIYIEDNTFSISDYGMKVTDLNDPGHEIAEVLFWPSEE